METTEINDRCLNNLCNEKGLNRCRRCGSARYCSKECQVQHWKMHKKCCKMISSSPEMFFRYYKALKSQGIGCNQSDNGDYDQALLSLQESLEILKEFQNDFLISNCYFSIGNVLFSKSQHEEALVSYRKSLEIYREIHGENHGRTCCCYESIGNVLSAQGRYDDALIGYGKALAIRKKIYGDNHIDIGRSYYNIGLGQLKKGDYNGALISLEKAKEICSRELGSEHPRTVQLTVYIDFCQNHN